MQTYLSRADVSRAAARAGLVFFESVRPADVTRKHLWQLEERDPTAAHDYATAWAKPYDWISHIEITPARRPVLVITVPLGEVPVKVPKDFDVQPVTPSLWEPDPPRRAPGALAATMTRTSSAGLPPIPALPSKAVPAGTTKKGRTLELMQREGGVTLAELHTEFGGTIASVKALLGDVKRMGYQINFTGAAYIAIKNG